MAQVSVGNRRPLTPRDVTNHQRSLLTWHRTNARHFPWRLRRGEPFAILLAEILLRKTTAKQVAAVYPDFIATYSAPSLLAGARITKLRALLKPLGLSGRASLLKALGAALVANHGGLVPTLREDLLKLPGVGPYAANATLCFGFGQSVPIVDSNILRILSRVFGWTSSHPRPHLDKAVWDLASGLIPTGRAALYNEALLDLGALVCTHRDPACYKCPLGPTCLSNTAATENQAVNS